MQRRPIAVLTDFGTGDPYVAAMKGVILSIHPGALIFDISHEIPRHDVSAAAFTLLSVEPYFPEGTIFVCVVDPEVGTDRRIILLRKGKRSFLAPDNGLLNFVSTGASGERWSTLDLPSRRRRPKDGPDRPDRPDGLGLSSTFHGRDIFAPAAARIAKGTPVARLTRPIPALPARTLFTRLPANPGAAVTGRILHIDHFGNIVTNIRMPVDRTGISLAIAGKRVARVCSSYDEGTGRSPFLIMGSTGLLEVSVRRGSAARTLGVKTGQGAVLRG